MTTCRFKNITSNIFMEFQYNNNVTYQANFSNWFGMNTKERINNNEKPLTSIIAKRKFSEMYGSKVLNEPKFGFDTDKIKTILNSNKE